MNKKEYQPTHTHLLVCHTHLTHRHVGMPLIRCHIMLQKLEDPDWPLPSKRARISAHNLTTDISQIFSAISRSMFSCSPLMIEVICDVMKSCRSYADFSPPFSFLGKMITQRFDDPSEGFNDSFLFAHKNMSKG
jgi:hypothetical protein